MNFAVFNAVRSLSINTNIHVAWLQLKRINLLTANIKLWVMMIHGIFVKMD